MPNVLFYNVRRFKSMNNKLISVRLNENLHREVLIKYGGSLSALIRVLLRDYLDKIEPTP